MRAGRAASDLCGATVDAVALQPVVAARGLLAFPLGTISTSAASSRTSRGRAAASRQKRQRVVGDEATAIPVWRVGVPAVAAQAVAAHAQDALDRPRAFHRALTVSLSTAVEAPCAARAALGRFHPTKPPSRSEGRRSPQIAAESRTRQHIPDTSPTTVWL
jgi:hypothetical protein